MTPETKEASPHSSTLQKPKMRGVWVKNEEEKKVRTRIHLSQSLSHSCSKIMQKMSDILLPTVACVLLGFMIHLWGGGGEAKSVRCEGEKDLTHSLTPYSLFTHSPPFWRRERGRERKIHCFFNPSTSPVQLGRALGHHGIGVPHMSFANTETAKWIKERERRGDNKRSGRRGRDGRGARGEGQYFPLATSASFLLSLISLLYRSPCSSLRQTGGGGDARPVASRWRDGIRRESHNEGICLGSLCTPARGNGERKWSQAHTQGELAKGIRACGDVRACVWPVCRRLCVYMSVRKWCLFLGIGEGVREHVRMCACMRVAWEWMQLHESMRLQKGRMPAK